MKGKLSLDFDPRIENYSLSLSNSKLKRGYSLKI